MNSIDREAPLQALPRTWNSSVAIVLSDLRHQGVPSLLANGPVVTVILPNDPVHSGSTAPAALVPVPPKSAVEIVPSTAVPLFLVSSPVMNAVLHWVRTFLLMSVIRSSPML